MIEYFFFLFRFVEEDILGLKEIKIIACVVLEKGEERRRRTISYFPVCFDSTRVVASIHNISFESTSF